MNNNHVYLNKIEEFKQFTNIRDDELARKYLMRNNWNVENSVVNYLDDSHTLPSSQRTDSATNTNYQTSHNVPSQNSSGGIGFFGMINNILSFGTGLFMGHNERNFTNIYSNTSNNSTYTPPRNNNIERIESQQKIQKLFDFIPSSEINFKNFLNKLRQRPGILIVYNSSSFNKLSGLVSNIRDEDIFKNQTQCYSIHLIDSSTIEYKELSKNFSIHNFPAIIYINKTQLNIVNHENVVLIDENFTINSFRETLYTLIEDPRNTPSSEVTNSRNDVNNNTHNIMDNYQKYDKDYYPQNDSELIHFQNQELKELERLAEEQKKKEQRDKSEKEKKELEEKKKMEEKEMTIKMLKSKLPTEPDANDPDAYLIAFRSPHNDLRKERRFKKTDKVQTLYDFVESHADEFEVKNFSLFRPFLGNLENRDKSIEEEKLSNAVLQIKEL